MNAHFVTGVDYGTLSGRGIEVDHVTIYRWAQRFTPLSGTAGSPTKPTSKLPADDECCGCSATAG
jgi:hypothetical protein